MYYMLLLLKSVYDVFFPYGFQYNIKGAVTVCVYGSEVWPTDSEE